MNLNLGDSQWTTAHIQGLDAAGLPGTFVKPPTWTVDDSTIATVTLGSIVNGVLVPDTTGLNCVIQAAIPAKSGTCTVTCTDQDNPSVTPLTITVLVTGEAVNTLSAQIDTPTERPPVTPPAPAPTP